MSLRTELLQLELEVKARIAARDPTKPMDSGPFWDLLSKLRKVCRMHLAELHVFKVAGKLESVKKFPLHEAYQAYAKAMFFVRHLEATQRSMVFQPRCLGRPTYLKLNELFYLAAHSFEEEPCIIAAKLFDLGMELAGDCIISGDPLLLGDPKQNRNITHYYKWTSVSGWTCVFERRSEKGAPAMNFVHNVPTDAHIAEYNWQVMRRVFCQGGQDESHVTQGRASDDAPGCELEVGVGTGVSCCRSLGSLENQTRLSRLAVCKPLIPPEVPDRCPPPRLLRSPQSSPKGEGGRSNEQNGDAVNKVKASSLRR